MTKRQGGVIDSNGLVAEILMKLTIVPLETPAFCFLSESSLYALKLGCVGKDLLLMYIMR